MKREITKQIKLDDIYLVKGEIIEINPHTCHIRGDKFNRYFDYPDIDIALENSKEVEINEGKQVFATLEETEPIKNDTFETLQDLLITVKLSDSLSDQNIILLAISRICSELRRENREVLDKVNGKSN